jgi:hypothetical protein
MKKNVIIIVMMYIWIGVSCSNTQENKSKIVLDSQKIFAIDIKSLNIDFVGWKNDSLGCIGERRKILQQIEKEKVNILGIKDRLAIYYFGKPNYVIMDNNSKVFVYYNNGGPQCNPDFDRLHPEEIETYITCFYFKNDSTLSEINNYIE